MKKSTKLISKKKKPLIKNVTAQKKVSNRDNLYLVDLS